METPQITILFELKITDVLSDGFIGTDVGTTKLFKKKSLIKDKFALRENNFKKDDIVKIKISTIDESKIKEDKKGKEFYCVIFELTNSGFYTKKYDENENRFSRIFLYEARGMITFTKEEFERFDVGDIIKIEVRK